MTIAIGGWLLLSCTAFGTASPITINDAVRQCTVTRGFDTATECEKVKNSTQVCIPALATVNR